MYHNPTETDTGSYGLTSKQHEALALAVERDYFAVPRDSLTALAEESGSVAKRIRVEFSADFGRFPPKRFNWISSRL